MKKGCLIGLVLICLFSAGMVIGGPQVIEQVMKWLYPRPYEEIVRREAAEFGLEENLVYAVIRAESGFDEQAESHAGAHGLMQLTEARLIDFFFASP